MDKLLVKAPINSTSLGNVSLNILREMFQLDLEVALFPVQDNIDITVFNELSEDFRAWLGACFKHRHKMLNRDTPTFKIWHIKDSFDKLSDKSFLYSFYELDKPTFTEVKILKMHDGVMFSSSHAANCFKNAGIKSCSYIPLGFDPDLKPRKRVAEKGVVHFGLMGKFEKRKRTKEIIQAWAKKYGNRKGYLLSCAITNKFMPTEKLNAELAEALEGKQYFNINFLPFLPKNSDVNQFLNNIDIDLTGLSGAEGWNLPAFNATCLGKWSCVQNHTSHKDWATPENSILVEPEYKIKPDDGIFFKTGLDYNQGHIHSLSELGMMTAMEDAEKKVGKFNIAGQNLQSTFSYKKTTQKILEKIF